MARSVSSRNLKKFMRSNKIGPVEAARALDVTHPAVIAWANGTRTPDDTNRRRIQVWTAGAVMADEWGAARPRKAVEPFARGPEAA